MSNPDLTLMRRLADTLTRGISTGHDWPNSQDELTRLQCSDLLRNAADEIEASRAAAPAGTDLQKIIFFFASVIKSGESWSQECEHALIAARAAIPASAGEWAGRFWADDEGVYLNPQTDAGEIAVQRDEGKELQAVYVAPALAAPAGEPAERRDAKQAVFEAAVVAHGVRFAVRKLRRPDIPSLEAIWVGVDEALAAPAGESLAPLKAANLSAALRAIVRECRGPERPFSTDSYLPPHLLDLAVAALESAETQEHETPLQVIEAMQRNEELS